MPITQPYIPLAVTFFLSRLNPETQEFEVLGISRGSDWFNIGLIGGKTDPITHMKTGARDIPYESPKTAIIRELFEEGQVLTFEPVPIFSRFDPKKHFLCVTFTSPFVILPEVLPDGPEGRVGWHPVSTFLKECCTFREYNELLFQQLGLV